MPQLPIPIDILRTRLRIEVESDDTDLAALCIAAGELIERETGTALRSQTFVERIAGWKRTPLRRGPVTAVTQVTYTDTNGNSATLPVDEWFILQDDELIVLDFDTSAVFKENTQPVVTYTAGWTTVPHALQQCIVALVGAWYTNPEASSVAALTEVPLSYKHIIQHYSHRSPLR
jgi:phage conserved hypothetical protein, phiE125 gp8 family